jgi:hypothetical protein
MTGSTPIPVVLVERGLPRLPPRTPRLSHRWPDTVIFIDVARTHGTGGPAILGRYVVRGAQHERVQGWFCGLSSAPAGFTPPPGSGLLIPLREKRKATRGHFGFLEDIVMKMAYREHPRAVIAGWDLPAIIGSLAAHTTKGGRDKGSLSHVLWTFPEGKHAGGEDKNRPRIEVRPLEGRAALISFKGRANHDAQDYVPPPGREREQRRKRDTDQLKNDGWKRYKGRFADLQALAYTTTGSDRLSLPQACASFGVELASDHAIATPENMVTRMHAIEQLHDAIIGDLT